MNLNRKRIKTLLIGSAASLLCFLSLSAQDTISTYQPIKFSKQISMGFRPDYVFPTNSFLRGDNSYEKRINYSSSFHLTYSLQYEPNSDIGQIYGQSNQGVGFATYNFHNAREVGSPMAIYLFQAARIANFNPYIALRYEWNFGISWGWKPYDPERNPFNGGVGTRRNAYLDLGVFIDWRLTRHFDLITGVSFSHFSNGNTKYPNAGVNTGGARIGLAYYFNRSTLNQGELGEKRIIPKFPKHISYDLLIFGSWRRKGVSVDDKIYATHGSYPVCGFSFAPLYNITYKFRAGLSLDGVYDGSANMYAEEQPVALGDESVYYEFLKPDASKRFALGMSARAEYVMPFFSIGFGMGYNLFYSSGDTKGFYQTLALKVNLTRSAYLNIGYNLQNFSTPNYLMLGIGYRFHNRYPRMKWL